MSNICNDMPPVDPSILKKVGLKAIWRDGNVFGLTCIISSIVIQIILGVLISIITYGFNDLYGMLMSPYGLIVQQIIGSTAIFGIPFMIAGRISAGSIKGMFSFNRVGFPLVAAFVAVGLGFSVVDNSLVNIYAVLLEKLGVSVDYSSLTAPDGVLGAIVYLLTLAVLPAFLEEFAFRGIVMGCLRRHGNALAVIGSSLLFGLIHGNFIQIPFAFALGCFFAYADILCDSVWPSVIIHFINNLTAGITTLLTDRVGITAANIFACISSVVYTALGIIGFIWLCKKYRNPFSSLKNGPFNLGEALKKFVFSPGIILSVIVFGGEAVAISLLM